MEQRDQVLVLSAFIGVHRRPIYILEAEQKQNHTSRR